MFSTKPQDIAKFREVTNAKKGGVSVRMTFKCPRCKDIFGIESRRRRGSHIKDGFICVHCKDELASKSKVTLAED